MRKICLLSILIFLLTASILAEVFPVENLIERALEIAPSLKSALLSIEDAEIELKRAMYNEASLSKNTLNLRRKAVEDAILAFSKAKDVVKDETIKLSLSSIKARHNLRQKEIALSQAQRDLEIAVVKYERGTISLNDLINAEDKVVSASESFLVAEESFILADEKLKLHVGLELDSELIVDPNLEPVVIEPTLDEIILATKATDTSYLQALNNVTSKQEELNQLIEDEEALLSIRQKEIALEKAKIDLATKEANVISAARTTYNSYLGSKKTLENARLEVVRQQKRLEQANKQHLDGLINLNSLTDIKYQLEIALMRETEAKWELHIAGLTLQKLLAREGESL
jgi:outer membrane protein TolC